MGAYLQLVTPGIPLLGAWIYAGPYAIPNYSVEFTGVFTNTTPTDAYRGAGRPGGDVRDRADDGRARGRARAWTGSSCAGRTSSRSSRHTLASGLTIDSGDYVASLDKLLELLDLDVDPSRSRRSGARTGRRSSSASASRRTTRCAASRRRGSSARSATRPAAGSTATIRCLPTGSVQVITGTSPHGQGHETAWAQIVADQLGCDIDAVEVLHGDTSISSQRHGHVRQPEPRRRRRRALHAAEKVIDKAREIVAHQLEVSAGRPRVRERRRSRSRARPTRR